MQTSFDILIVIIIVVGILDAAVLATLILYKLGQKRSYRGRQSSEKKFRDTLLSGDAIGLSVLAGRAPRRFVRLLRLVCEVWRQDELALTNLRNAALSSGLAKMAKKHCESFFLAKRLNGYFLASFFDTEDFIRLLITCLSRETVLLGRALILQQLAETQLPVPLAGLARTLDSSAQHLLPAEISLLQSVGMRHAGELSPDDLPAEGSGLFLRIGLLKRKPDQHCWNELAKIAELDGPAGELAVAAMAEVFPASWFLQHFSASRKEYQMREYCRLCGQVLTPQSLGELLPYLEFPALKDVCLHALAEIDQRYPEAAGDLLLCLETATAAAADTLSLALEFRLPYLIHHAGAKFGTGLIRMLECLVRQQRSGSILAVLESDMSAGLRNMLLSEVKKLLLVYPKEQDFFAMHASIDLQKELGLPRVAIEEDKPRIPVKIRDKLFLGILALAALAIVPLVFALKWRDQLAYLTLPEILYRFVFEFHYLFAWYTVVVNMFYLMLLLLSALKLFAQSRLWESGLKHFLFASRMLPTVTIIAPAYNEEATIADSVESLLALVYPQYQVVVVNDGSKDGTLATLIDAFKLTASASGSSGILSTMPVRTVYRSAQIPNLLVIDKTNGGKADALNAGLNYAEGDYVCCIDADSLLDPQALLRTMVQILGRRKTVIAAGGNIFPVNGSDVEHGHLQRIGLPSTPLAAFQTMEYLRSFVSGRLGWALMDSLLIISGAYGVFRKDRVLSAGGYMTGKGRYRKDTVGEDMELVVRLLRQEHEQKLGGTIDYCYNANCWTEVPEDDKSLDRQRDRWHRGLIEVVLHHKAMLFNPRYGMSGLLSLPYFFFFELIGPWLELSGYLVLGFSLLFGLVDPLVSLIVFSIAVFFGVLISLSSILLAERQVVYFRFKEFLKLVVLAIGENFGFRQKMSLSRVGAFVQFFYKSKGWQKFGRKGFRRGGGGK